MTSIIVTSILFAMVCFQAPRQSETDHDFLPGRRLVAAQLDENLEERPANEENDDKRKRAREDNACENGNHGIHADLLSDDGLETMSAKAA